MRRQLLAWFDRHKRDLPWRQTLDPYRIWLSEIMLQQTQVATVIPYFMKFLKRFPNVRSLASGDLDEVLRLWAGLGYYSRARNLHKTACLIANNFDGTFPCDPDTLRSLPGVGRYTAGAIASIAFGLPEPVVDGNVKRVLARILNLRGDVSEKRVEETIWKHARQLLPKDGCGDFNQALMELGATVCLPRREARCSSCPISSHCKARVAGTVHLLPYKSSKPRIEHETHVVAAICRRGEWLFVRRPPNGLWGGLWELPSTVLNSGDARIAARRLAKRAVTGTMTLERAPFCTVEHQLTHRKIKMVGYLCKASTGRNDGNGNARWLRLDRTNSLALSQAMKRVLTRLAEHIR